LKLGSLSGRICLNCPADLIAVDGDPLKDARALSRVVFVMRGGKIIKRPQ
jgi:imidazolonepropionase-like amidohydrolase